VPKKLYTFEAKTTLNREKAGAWTAQWSITNDQDDETKGDSSAWKNPSAAKKWLKAQAEKHTPRKSVKLVPGPELDEKDKPVKFFGSFTFRELK
jgi:hypothetical protein